MRPMLALDDRSCRFRFIMWSNVHDVRVIAIAVRHACEPILGELKAMEVELGLVEVCNNIIIHGYGADPGPIAVDLIEHQREIVIVVEDEGFRPPSFDFQPTARPDIDLLDLDDLPEGGFGLALVRQCFDDLRYSTDDRRNRLTLTKSATGIAPSPMVS